MDDLWCDWIWIARGHPYVKKQNKKKTDVQRAMWFYSAKYSITCANNHVNNDILITNKTLTVWNKLKSKE